MSKEWLLQTYHVYCMYTCSLTSGGWATGSRGEAFPLSFSLDHCGSSLGKLGLRFSMHMLLISERGVHRKVHALTFQAVRFRGRRVIWLHLCSASPIDRDPEDRGSICWDIMWFILEGVWRAKGIDKMIWGDGLAESGCLVKVREISGVEVSNYQRIGDLISLISLAKTWQPSCILYLLTSRNSSEE